MGFYDSVKDRVRSEEHPGEDEDADQEAGQQEDDDMPFDHLKKRAGEGQEENEEETGGDDTDIEVLASGERVDQQPQEPDQEEASHQQRTATDTGGQEQNPRQSRGSGQQDSTPSQQAAETATRTVQEQSGDRAQPQDEGDRDELVSVLRNIEEQNADILTVLRGIKRSLDSADGP